MVLSEFRVWLLENRGLTDFTKWLLINHTDSIELSDQVYVPTFHETLAEYCKRMCTVFTLGPKRTYCVNSVPLIARLLY